MSQSELRWRAQMLASSEPWLCEEDEETVLPFPGHSCCPLMPGYH